MTAFSLPLLLQGDVSHPDGLTLLALARRQGVLPDADGLLVPPCLSPRWWRVIAPTPIRHA